MRHPPDCRLAIATGTRAVSWFDALRRPSPAGGLYRHNLPEGSSKRPILATFGGRIACCGQGLGRHPQALYALTSLLRYLVPDGRNASCGRMTGSNSSNRFGRRAFRPARSPAFWAGSPATPSSAKCTAWDLPAAPARPAANARVFPSRRKSPCACTRRSRRWWRRLPSSSTTEISRPCSRSTTACAAGRSAIPPRTNSISAAASPRPDRPIARRMRARPISRSHSAATRGAWQADPARGTAKARARMSAIYDFAAKSLDGRDVPLADYRGQVLLIVNTASKCGFTPQYAGLEALHEKLHGEGFSVLGFPCNQFGHQEPGSASEIGAFCTKNYGVSFPMFEKIDVNGANAHPLF